jgi:hypothetical protein
MITTSNYQMASVPAVFVTKGRQRVKQYGNSTVYLRNGDEFEIELFNPTTNKVLAKISLNGKSLGSGIVLRPGERVFLERYLDEAKKFLFDTYEVNGTDSAVKEAIKLNGVVDVEFYDEQKPHQLIWNSSTITYTMGNPTWTTNNPGVFYTNTGADLKFGGSSPTCDNNTLQTKGSAKTRGIDVEAAYQCYSANVADGQLFNANNVDFSDNFANAMKCCAKVEPLETGRIEKGSVSNQGFVYDSTVFNLHYSWKTIWTILPESQRPVVKEDLSVYCTNCGAKRKKSTHKFCPNCGSKF